MNTITVTINVAQVGTGHIAITDLAGIRLRGRRADTPTEAVRSVLWTLAHTDSDDAAIALDLALEGANINTTFGELDKP